MKYDYIVDPAWTGKEGELIGPSRYFRSLQDAIDHAEKSSLDDRSSSSPLGQYDAPDRRSS